MFTENLAYMALCKFCQGATAVHFGALISNQLTTNVNTNTKTHLYSRTPVWNVQELNTNQTILQVINAPGFLGFFLLIILSYFKCFNLFGLVLFFLFDCHHFNWQIAIAMFWGFLWPGGGSWVLGVLNLANHLYEAMFLSWI